LRRDDATYSTRTRRPRKTAKPSKSSGLSIPKWIPYGATALFALVLCLTVNLRSFTQLNREAEQNESLNQEIEKLTGENLNLQEEIYYLQNDSGVIEREAKKFGFQRKEKKVSVPTDK